MTNQQIDVARASLSEFEHESKLMLDICTAVAEKEDIAVTIDPHGAIASFAKYKYQVSIPKLCAGIAGLLAPLAEPKSPYCVGLALITALAAFEGVARRLTIDEAAVCQSLSDELLKGKEAVLPIVEIVKRVGTMTKGLSQLDTRVSKAISTLEEKRILISNPSEKTVQLCEIVFLGWR